MRSERQDAARRGLSRRDGWPTAMQRKLSRGKRPWTANTGQDGFRLFHQIRRRFDLNSAVMSPLGFLFDPILGRTPLKRVIVAYCLIPNLVLGFGLSILFAETANSRLPLYIGYFVAAYQAVAIWRCAFNGPSKRIGVYLRICVLTGIFACLALLLFASPGA